MKEEDEFMKFVEALFQREPRVNEIEFTQFIRPNGRRERVWTVVATEIWKMAEELRDRGWKFEIELLNDDSTVSMEVCNEDTVLACELCANGPDVPKATEKMIREAHSKLVNEKMRGNPRDE